MQNNANVETHIKNNISQHLPTISNTTKSIHYYY